MKRLLKLFPLTLLLCLALALGLTACGEKSYSVTAEYDSTAGSVVLSDEGKNSDGKYQEGTSVTVTVTPNTGYDVASFTVNGTAQTLSGSSYTFTVKEDTKIAVTFGAAFSVTLEKDFDEAAGTASLSAPQNGTKYAKDELVTLTVTANEGYLVEAVTVGGEAVELNEGKYSFKVKADTQVKVTLRAIAHYKVTVGTYDDAMGSVSVTPNADADGKYVENTQLTLAVSVRYGHKLLSVKVNGSDVTLDESGKYSFKIDKDTTVDVSFEELKQYKMTFSFDETMCALAYLGETDDGEEGYLPLSPDTETEIYEGETVFTVTPVGGYEISAVTVNGEQVTLSDKSFTLNVGEALLNESGKIEVVVSCRFSSTKLDSFEGEYDLADDVWYSFTLESPAVFEFSANNYVAYAAFYVMTQEDGDGSAWDEKDKTPVWIFNPNQDNIDYAINTFEAGSYMVRLSANTGDGVASSKLTVTKLTYLDFEIKNIRVPSYVSLDGQYILYVGSHYLVLKDKDEKLIDTTVTRTDEAGNSYTNVAFGGKTYRFAVMVPIFTEVDSDDETAATPVEGLIVSFVIMEGDAITEEIDFRPDPLPTGVKINEKLAGTYTGVTYETEVPVEGDLVVRGSTIKWGEKEITLLSNLDVCSAPNEVSKKVSVGYCEKEVFFLYAILNDGMYQIVVLNATDENQVVFSPKEDDGTVTIDQKYWGTWVGTGSLSDYRFTIEEHNITITKNGEPVQTKLGKFESKSNTFPTFTLDNEEYYLGTVVRGSITVSAVKNGASIGTITARWTISVSAQNATVTIENQAEEYVNNAKVTFTVTPQAGYTVTAVKVNDKAVTATDGKYSFFISANTVITVECEPAATATAETSPLAFDDELVGTWQNSELKVTVEKNSVTVADAEGNALSHSLRTETYRGRQYNAVVLGETCYLFLKANGT